MEIENLIKLINTVSESDLTGLKYEENGVKLHLTKKKEQAAGCEAGYGMSQAATSVNVPSAGDAESTDGAESTAGQKPSGKLIESPLVGTFYAAPAEDAAPFVAVGDTVKRGQTLAIIEAMKLMNEIESEYDGTIAEVLVENGQPVEYGQPLFRIQ